MIDFLITPSGDLAFVENQKENKKLEIMFYNTKAKALKIDFDMETYSQKSPTKDCLTVNFEMIHTKNNKKAMLVEDDAYTAQQVLMRIKTSLGELSERPEIGSTIETVMHKNLNDKLTQSEVEKIIGDAIKDVLYNYSVKAIPEIQKENGYKQVMKILIYEDNEFIVSYEMEG